MAQKPLGGGGRGRGDSMFVWSAIMTIGVVSVTVVGEK